MSMQSKVVSLIDFKEENRVKVVEQAEMSEDALRDSLDHALDTCEGLADEAIVILMIGDRLVSGATTDDKQLLMSLIAMATEELEGLEE
jgi:chaperonin cofactor prefoldin